MPKLNSAHTYVSGANGSVPIGMSVGSEVRMRFSYDASGNVVAVDYSTDGGSTYTTYYYVRNAQNDIVKLIDNSGNSVVEYTYDSWGKIVATTGSLANTVGANQPFRYRGYVYDEETGWYYLQSRYYDPITCRFISADVLLSTGQGVIGHNAFAYCLNEPINRIDDTGAFSLKNIIDFFRNLVEGGGGGGGNTWAGRNNYKAQEWMDWNNPNAKANNKNYKAKSSSFSNLNTYFDNPKALENMDPKVFYDYLVSHGFDVNPLGKGSLKGIPFNKGGGFRVNWGGDKVLTYHPAYRSHHSGAYYKLSSGETGSIRIEIE